MARVKGKKELKRYARAESVIGVKASSHPEYVKVECPASPSVRVGHIRGFASTNYALKTSYNPNQLLSKYAEDVSFRHAVDCGLFRKRNDVSLAFYSVIEPRNAYGGTLGHRDKVARPALGHSVHKAYKSRKPPSKRVSFVVDLDVPDFIDFGGPLPYSFAEALNILMQAREQQMKAWLKRVIFHQKQYPGFAIEKRIQVERLWLRCVSGCH